MVEEEKVSVAESFDRHELPWEEADAFRRQVMSDTEERRDFLEILDKLGQQNPRGVKAQQAKEYAEATARWLLGQTSLTRQAFAELGTYKDSLYYLGRCLAELGDWPGAVGALKQFVKKHPQSAQLRMALAEAQAFAGQLKDAQKTLTSVDEAQVSPAQFTYLKGVLLELAGEVEEALAQYQAVLASEPDHLMTNFRLAYNLDLRGEDEEAIKYYEQCVRHRPTFTNALVNLGVLYEDLEKYEQAAACFRRVLKSVPNHPRAKLFLRDAVASTTMVIDEERERRADRRSRLLGIPVTDFELSVRSRSCLEKLGVRTLGDLTRVSEAQLLGFKNFGETSLNEIKRMLASRGLRLGQALEGEGGEEDFFIGEPQVEILSKPVAELEIPIRVRHCVESLGIVSLGELAQKTEQELLACRNFGESSLQEVKDKLAEYDLKLKNSQ